MCYLHIHILKFCHILHLSIEIISMSDSVTCVWRYRAQCKRNKLHQITDWEKAQKVSKYWCKYDYYQNGKMRSFVLSCFLSSRCSNWVDFCCITFRLSTKYKSKTKNLFLWFTPFVGHLKIFCSEQNMLSNYICHHIR